MNQWALDDGDDLHGWPLHAAPKSSGNYLSCGACLSSEAKFNVSQNKEHLEPDETPTLASMIDARLDSAIQRARREQQQHGQGIMDGMDTVQNLILRRRQFFEHVMMAL